MKLGPSREFTGAEVSRDDALVPEIPRSAPRHGKNLPMLRNRRETLPHRPPRVPRWRPATRAGQTETPRSVVEGWREPKVLVADDLGCMRVSFTYDQMSSVSAVYSEKARRTHYDESAHEASFLRWLTVDTRFTKIQFQPFTISIRTNTGRERRYTVDVIFETQEGVLGCAEIKATPDYFHEPKTDDTLTFCSKAVMALGIPSGITRWAASDISKEISDNVKHIYDKRQEGFDPAHAALVRDLIQAEGGLSTLGVVAKALPLRSLDAQDVLCAMTCRRLIGIDLTRPFCPELPVFVPPEPANPGILQAFLKQFLREDAA